MHSTLSAATSRCIWKDACTKVKCGFNIKHTRTASQLEKIDMHILREENSVKK
jgi:hypothetical protein